jgi:hypothetical protein
MRNFDLKEVGSLAIKLRRETVLAKTKAPYATNATGPKALSRS